MPRISYFVFASALSCAASLQLGLLPTGLSGAASAEEATIAAPTPGVANYDPQLSAKEAVLANWELAASGILAGQVVSRQVAELAETDAPYEKLAHQARFALKTMLQRYNSAAWVYASGAAPSSVDGAALRAVVAAAETECVASDCSAERAALRAAFQAASDQLGAAAATAREAVEARQGLSDAVLMTEQLSIIADYLESGDWAEELNLTAFGRDGEVVSARIVGTAALWNNIEAYVGLTSPEVDAAINAANKQLLRKVVRTARRAKVLDPEGAAVADLKAAAAALAAELRRAAALFAA